MSKLDAAESLKKYAPSGQKLLLHGGISILACIILGFLYSAYIMETSADLAEENEAAFRQGIGLGIGIFMSLIPVTFLIVRYIYQLIQARKKALAEIMDANNH